MKEIVTQKELSDFLGVSQQAVSKMNFPRIPNSIPIQYDFLEAIKYYLEQKRQEEKRINLGEERAKLAKAQRLKIDIERELKKIELARVKDKLIEVATIEKEWAKILLTVRSKLLAIPSRMAVVLDGQSKIEIEKRLREVIEEALTELSQTETEGN